MCHTFAVRSPEPNPRPDGAQNVPGYSAALTLRGMIYPEKQSAAFERFAVELAQPYVLFTYARHGDKFAVGGRVEWNAKTFAIRAPAIVFTGIGAADHTEVLLEDVTTSA